MYLAISVFSVLIMPSVTQAREYKVQSLDNGITLITAPTTMVPLVYLNVTFLAGAMAQTKETDGLVHYLEHMLYKGNGLVKDSTAFKKRARQLGMEYKNATVGATHMDYFAFFPTAFMEESVEFLSAPPQSLKLDPKEVEMEKTIILDEYNRWKGQKYAKLFFSVNKLLTGEMFHTSLPIGTTKKAIMSVTPELLKQIKHKVVNPKNATITLAGDITHDQGLKLIQKYFGQWKSPKDWKEVEIPKLPDFPKKTQRWNYSDPKSSNAYIHTIFEGVDPKKNTKEYIVASMLSDLVFHKGGKFYKKFIQSGKMMYGGISSSPNFYKPEIIIYSSVAPDQVDNILAGFASEIKLWAEPGYFSKEHLSEIVRQRLVSQQINEDNFIQYATTISRYARLYSPEFYLTYLDLYRQITEKDVTEFVKRYIVGKPHVISVYYNKKEADDLKVDLNGDKYFETEIEPYIEPKT